MPTITANFKTLQSGDPVRITFPDATPDLDATYRRFAGQTNIVLVTTPVGENDPALQTIHYIDDFASLASPIPLVLVANDIDTNVGDSVEVRFAASGSGSTLTGTITAVSPNTGVVEVTDGGDVYVCKDFWYIKKL